ncbi:MAG: bifunctional UDP-N-acetylglucosamine diphosphorylase/glucosamine-1-phosphate N-acetyltransferase GlmU [Pseudomonadota bacterium]
MPVPDTLSVILAAGKGTRMKSDIPKPLHQIAGRTLLGHAMHAARAAEHSQIAVVIGPDMDNVKAETTTHDPSAQTFVQHRQAGTADAVLAAKDAIRQHNGDMFVLFCDTPMLQAETLNRVSDALDQGANIVVLGFEADDPTGYGRLLTDTRGELIAIREDRDATEAERQTKLCNSGVMAFRCPDLLGLLDRIGNDNSKGEYYLTDAIAIAREDGLSCKAITCDEEELLGINDRVQLATAESKYQQRLRRQAMINGATMIAPETVWLSYDTVIGQDVVIEPNVFIGPNVTIEDGALIRANSHLEGAHVAAACRVGPFARLRPGARLGDQVHVGNFVEVKNVEMGRGAKANHLAYLGDGTIGEGANIGAGTIFCNYDGFRKHTTTVKKGAFVGSNSALVAPVEIGEGAFVGSGSVVTKNVPADSLMVERAPITVKEGWAAKFRTMMSRRSKT